MEKSKNATGGNLGPNLSIIENNNSSFDNPSSPSSVVHFSDINAIPESYTCSNTNPVSYVEPVEEFSNIPKIIIKRNKYGLLEGINYFFTKEGFVDWRKMLKPEHLAPDKNKTKETDISKLDDSKLIILKSGIEYLAWLRGFKSVRYSQIAQFGYVTTKCSIQWNPNFETENKDIIFESCADASKENTNDGISSIYLSSISQNRAFARCVRNFLRIGIVAEEEIKESQPSSEAQSANPVDLFKQLLAQTGYSFEQVKKKMVEEQKEGAEAWNNENDIPKPILFEIIGRIKIKLEEKKKNES